MTVRLRIKKPRIELKASISNERQTHTFIYIYIYIYIYSSYTVEHYLALFSNFNFTLTWRDSTSTTQRKML